MKKINHIICILKTLTDLYLINQRIKIKNAFVGIAYSVFSSENILTEHKENFLKGNGKQNVKLGKGSISFKNYSTQLPVPFKIYADFERIA